MKVILLQDVDNLGDEGDVVTVKDGYGRNFLIPRGWAEMATKGAVKARSEERRQQVRKRAQERDDALALQREIEKTEVVVEVKVGEENRIFGTVTPQQVAVKLAMQGFNIERRHIRIEEDIRLIGVYTAMVKLFSDVEAPLKIRVVPEGGALAPAEEDTAAEAPATEAPAAEATAADAAATAEADPAPPGDVEAPADAEDADEDED